ncbi:bifunctional 5,10-methylenetetrahydrofolate dehydrogenase/5,10-methenyltetrahydrofolate cyclohydrolase [Rickettsiales bacterium LUAb2]
MNHNKIINCLEHEEKLNAILLNKLTKVKDKYNINFKLATILVGDNPASHIYVKNKTNKANLLGISVQNICLPSNTNENELLDLINNLNNDPSINGILVQLPLPSHINSNKIVSNIHVNKDVDGLNPINLGFLASENYNYLFPCTPLGILYVLQQETSLMGKNALVIGRSKLVGLPTSLLLLGKNCTVTTAHMHTKNLAALSKLYDIIVVAIGSPLFINQSYIKKDAIVIDVGINKVVQNNKSVIVGDVNTNDVLPLVSAITPVPNGIGRLTTTFLMYNVYKAALLQNNIFDDSYDIFL